MENTIKLVRDINYGIFCKGIQSLSDLKKEFWNLVDEYELTISPEEGEIIINKFFETLFDEDGNLYDDIYYDEDEELFKKKNRKIKSKISNVNYLDDFDNIEDISIDFEGIYNEAIELGFTDDGEGEPLDEKDLRNIINTVVGVYLTDKDNVIYEQVRDYLEDTGFLIEDDEDDEDEEIDDEDIIKTWNNLEDMGYSEGDIIMSDDFVECSVSSNIEDMMDEIESTYDVIVLAPEVIKGSGPGNYKAIERII